MGKPNFSAELPEETLRQIEELRPLFDGNKRQVVIRAISELYEREIVTMTTKQAATRIVRVDGQNERIELRAGAKGTGKVLWACNYWPNSGRSVEEMGRMLSEYVRDNSIELAQGDGVLAHE